VNAIAVSIASDHSCKLPFMGQPYYERIAIAIESAIDRGLFPTDPRRWNRAISDGMALNDQPVSVQAAGLARRGKLTFKLATNEALAKVLRVNPQWLATGAGEMLPSADAQLPDDALMIAKLFNRLRGEERQKMAARLHNMLTFEAAVQDAKDIEQQSSETTPPHGLPHLHRQKSPA